MAGPTGLEPATSDVTGRRSNQLNYDPAPFDETLNRALPISIPCTPNLDSRCEIMCGCPARSFPESSS